jgi:hypothetical protein
MWSLEGVRCRRRDRRVKEEDSDARPEWLGMQTPNFTPGRSSFSSSSRASRSPVQLIPHPFTVKDCGVSTGSLPSRIHHTYARTYPKVRDSREKHIQGMPHHSKPSGSECSIFDSRVARSHIRSCSTVSDAGVRWNATTQGQLRLESVSALWRESGRSRTSGLSRSSAEIICHSLNQGWSCQHRSGHDALLLVSRALTTPL